MRFGAVAVLACALAVAGCGAGAYTCESAEQCNEGVCQPTGFCSFPDPSCESGQRYGEFSGMGLSGRCVQPSAGSSTGEVGTTSGQDPASTSGATTMQGADSSPSSESGTTVAVSAGSSSSGEPSTSSGPAEGSSSSGEPLDPTLIAWWRLDEDPAGGVLDSTPNGLDGSCEVCPTPVPGVIGGALEFTGEEVILVEQPDAFISEVFTVTAWVRVDLIAEAPSFHHFVGKPVGTGNRNTFELFIANAPDPYVRFNVSNEASLALTQIAAPPLEIWTHLAGTFDGQVVRFYVDGEEVAENEAPPEGIAWDDQPVVMGGDIDGGDLRATLVGALDDVRVYARVLDGAEIAALASEP